MLHAFIRRIMLNPLGNPPALPGRPSKFDNSGRMPWFCISAFLLLRLLLLSTGCEKAPLRGQQP
jgi:hypothetical protein